MDLSLETILLMTPILLIALPVHEFAHAYVAYKLGDPTAKDMGRLTLNPFKHLDLLGVLMMYVARIGWAKPVPVNSGYFKNRKSGLILVAVAGPLSNLLLAFIFSLLLGLTAKLITSGIIVINTQTMEDILIYIVKFFDVFALVNIYLAIFNLLPVPPLDGSRLLSSFIPEESYYRFARYEQYIGFIFILLVVVLPGNVLGRIVGFFAEPIYNSMQTFTALVFGL